MIYSNKKSLSKVVHIEGCGYLKNKLSKNIIIFNDLKEAFSKGYTLCKKCNPLKKQYLEEREEILAFAKNNELKLSFTDTELSISSAVEQWKVVVSCDGNGIALYHKNTDNRFYDNYVPYYHNQEIKKESIVAYLKYIIKHAKYKKSNSYKNLTISCRKKKTKKASPKKENKKVILKLTLYNC